MKGGKPELLVTRKASGAEGPSGIGLLSQCRGCCRTRGDRPWLLACTCSRLVRAPAARLSTLRANVIYVFGTNCPIANQSVFLILFKSVLVVNIWLWQGLESLTELFSGVVEHPPPVYYSIPNCIMMTEINTITNPESHPYSCLCQSSKPQLGGNDLISSHSSQMKTPYWKM